MRLGYAFGQDDYGFDNVGANVDPATGRETIDPALTNNFRFQQRIHAIYVSEQGSSGAWNWLAMVRTEWMTTDALQVTDNVATASRYADVFPSLHVDRSLSDRSTVSIGASRRITRPNPSYLNPYVDHEYARNLNAGNPDLKPQFTQSFDLGYGYEGGSASCGITGYYRRNKDSMTDLTEYLGNGLTLTTKTNLPRSESAGVRVPGDRSAVAEALLEPERQWVLYADRCDSAWRAGAEIDQWPQCQGETRLPADSRRLGADHLHAHRQGSHTPGQRERHQHRQTGGTSTHSRPLCRRWRRFRTFSTGSATSV